MSAEATVAVLCHSRARGTAKVLMIGIANHHGDGGSWPKISTLAGYANVSERAVQYALNQLGPCPPTCPTAAAERCPDHLRELVVHVQEGGTRRTRDSERTNLFELRIECPEWCDRTWQHQPRKGWHRDPDGEVRRDDDPPPAPAPAELDQQQAELDQEQPDLPEPEQRAAPAPPAPLGQALADQMRHQLRQARRRAGLAPPLLGPPGAPPPEPAAG